MERERRLLEPAAEQPRDEASVQVNKQVSLEQLSARSVRAVLIVSYLGCFHHLCASISLCTGRYFSIIACICVADVQENGSRDQWLIYVSVCAAVSLIGLYATLRLGAHAPSCSSTDCTCVCSRQMCSVSLLALFDVGCGLCTPSFLRALPHDGWCSCLLPQQ